MNNLYPVFTQSLIRKQNKVVYVGNTKFSVQSIFVHPFMKNYYFYFQDENVELR